MLLRNGVVRARKPPTAQHPYGYARDQFIWSLISAVAIFCLGAGVSFYHGALGLLHPHELSHFNWSMAVMGGCITSLPLTFVMAVIGWGRDASAAACSESQLCLRR